MLQQSKSNAATSNQALQQQLGTTAYLSYFHLSLPSLHVLLQLVHLGPLPHIIYHLHNVHTHIHHKHIICYVDMNEPFTHYTDNCIRKYTTTYVPLEL